jgi:hypothetical protein
MDSRVLLLKNSFGHRGGFVDLPVFRGSSRYQYGEGLGDVLRGFWRMFRPVLVRGAQTALKAGGEALTNTSSLKDVLRSTIKPTVGSLLGATAEQLSMHISDERLTAAPPPGSLLQATLPITATTIDVNGVQQTGKGKGKRRRREVVYKSPSVSNKRFKTFSGASKTQLHPQPIRYNF